MNNQNLQVFSNEQFGEIRTVEINGEPWFAIKDVCKIFGEQNQKRISSRISDIDKGVSQIDTPGGMQNMVVVNESGLYSALFQMRPRKARGIPKDVIEQRAEKLNSFKRWVTSEVLPSIRKNGGYIAN